MSGQRREVGAPGNPSLLCEFQGWTGFDKACVSDINARRRGMRDEHGLLNVTYLFMSLTSPPGFIEI